MKWYCERSDERAIRIRGADNVSFLQTKLTCDARRWRMTGGGYATATDINGKVLFDGTFSMDGVDVVAILPAVLVDAALAHIDQYVIMEDVECELVDAPILQLPVEAEGLLGLDSQREEPARIETVSIGDTDVLAFRAAGPTSEAHRLVLIGQARAALEALGIDAKQLSDVFEDEVREGVPRIGRDFFVGKTIPLEAGLWNGVSLSKGCYLGQEVLERLFSRGNAARRLVRFTVDGPPPAAGDLILSGEDAAGAVTSAVADAAGSTGLAYIKRRYADAPLVLDGGRTLTRLGYVGGEWPENP